MIQPGDHGSMDDTPNLQALDITVARVMAKIIKHSRSSTARKMRL